MDKEIFIEKYWEEENILFIFHFKEGYAVRQIEISSSKTLFLSTDKPIIEDSFLFDQSFSTVDWRDAKIISKNEFETIWNNKT